MKTHISTLIIFLLSFSAWSSNLYGQEQADSVMVKVVLLDGNSFIGIKIDEKDNILYLKTDAYGIVEINMNQIKSIVIINQEELVDGEYKESVLQEARYLWAPNGYGLRKGEGYYQNIWIFFNQVSYGFSDNFSIGIGTMPLFLFAGTPSPVWITPKFSFPVVKNKVNVGLGVLSGTILGESGTGFGILYGDLTLGSRENNLTIGLGYGYAGGELADYPVVNLSAMFKVAPRGYILTENYIFPYGFSMLSAGGRTVWPDISLDYALVLPTGIGEFIAIPILGLVIPFNK